MKVYFSSAPMLGFHFSDGLILHRELRIEEEERLNRLQDYLSVGIQCWKFSAKKTIERFKVHDENDFEEFAGLFSYD
jgi:hypothetical protein